MSSFIKPGGQTILMTAARTGNADVVRMLLDRGGEDVNAARIQRRRNRPDVGCLGKSSGRREASSSNTAQTSAPVSTKMNYDQDRFGLEGVITVLPHGYWTPLMYAARQGSSAAARVLAESGASLDLTHPDGTSALILAIINSHFDTAALLLAKGADPNLADSTGMTPLYATVDVNTLGEVYGRPAQHQTSGDISGLDLMRLLLKAHANPNALLKSAALYRAHTPAEPRLVRAPRL